MDHSTIKSGRLSEGDSHKDRILQAHPIWASKSVGRIVRGRYFPHDRVGCKYLTLASEVENLRVGTCRNLAFRTLGVNNLLYERARINQTTESVEVIEKRACIIHDKMDLRNCFVVWGNVVIAM